MLLFLVLINTHLLSTKAKFNIRPNLYCIFYLIIFISVRALNFLVLHHLLSVPTTVGLRLREYFDHFVTVCACVCMWMSGCVCQRDKTKTSDRNDLQLGALVVLNTVSKLIDFGFKRSRVMGTGSANLHISQPTDAESTMKSHYLCQYLSTPTTCLFLASIGGIFPKKILYPPPKKNLSSFCFVFGPRIIPCYKKLTIKLLFNFNKFNSRLPASSQHTTLNILTPKRHILA